MFDYYSLLPFNHFDDDLQFLCFVFDIVYNTYNILHNTDQIEKCSDFSLSCSLTIASDKQL